MADHIARALNDVPEPSRLGPDVSCESDSEYLAASITGPLHPEQLTRGETLDEVCVGPQRDSCAAANWTLISRWRDNCATHGNRPAKLTLLPNCGGSRNSPSAGWLAPGLSLMASTLHRCVDWKRFPLNGGSHVGPDHPTVRSSQGASATGAEPDELVTCHFRRVPQHRRSDQ